MIATLESRRRLQAVLYRRNFRRSRTGVHNARPTGRRRGLWPDRRSSAVCARPALPAGGLRAGGQWTTGQCATPTLPGTAAGTVDRGQGAPACRRFPLRLESCLRTSSRPAATGAGRDGGNPVCPVCPPAGRHQPSTAKSRGRNTGDGRRLQASCRGEHRFGQRPALFGLRRLGSRHGIDESLRRRRSRPGESSRLESAVFARPPARHHPGRNGRSRRGEEDRRNRFRPGWHYGLLMSDI